MPSCAPAPVLAALLALAACAATPPQGRTPFAPSPGMEAVLRERQAMHAEPLAGLAIERAREVPTLGDAARAIPNVKGLPAPITSVPQFTELAASGAAGPLAARLYRPELARNTPVIIYFPGGTWATGSLDQFDESARQLAERTGWVVVAIRTRLAPEHKFPAAHDDALAAYRWARATMRSWGADPTRVVLAGEGPGANLALSTALAAREDVARGSSAIPDQLLLITPWAGTALGTESMRENRDSRPLPRRDVDWAQDQYTGGGLFDWSRPALRDPRLDLVARTDLAGLPRTTIILAPIDPLRSGGEALARNLAAAGVPVEAQLFPGTTYGFFGLARTVPEAAQAERYAADRLRAGFPSR